MTEEGTTFTATYKNWVGETRVRTLVPVALWFGSTKWHPEPQWLLRARDVADGPDARTKDYALAGFSDFAWPVFVLFSSEPGER